MKKVLLAIITILSAQLCASAQTEPPVITELHQLLQSAKGNFTAEIGKKLEEDTVSKDVFYEPKKAAVAAEAFILHRNAGQNMYILNYEATEDKIVALMQIVEQYLAELNKMVKTDTYTGEDYQDKKGNAVTDMRNKEGDLILRYTSNKKRQTVYIYGLNNTNAENPAQKSGNTTPNPAASTATQAFKKFYFQKANSTILRRNLMVDELVSTISAPKSGSITINLKDNVITIVTDGADDKVYTIRNVGSETTDQYSNKKVSITCTDAAGLPCTLAIRREHFYTSDNKMLVTLNYENGTGKGYTCNYEANLFEN